MPETAKYGTFHQIVDAHARKTHVIKQQPDSTIFRAPVEVTVQYLLPTKLELLIAEVSHLEDVERLMMPESNCKRASFAKFFKYNDQTDLERVSGFLRPRCSIAVTQTDLYLGHNLG